jgi:hypothetical protein
VNLIAERTRACFGSGDRLQAVILRGFELILGETTIFRMGPFSMEGKSAVQRHFPVNTALYAEHRTELFRSNDTSPRSRIHHVLSVEALIGSHVPFSAIAQSLTAAAVQQCQGLDESSRWTVMNTSFQNTHWHRCDSEPIKDNRLYKKLRLGM